MLCALCTTSLATALIGLLPSYDAIHAWAPRLLTVLRALQGFGFGGAWAGTILLSCEWCPQERRRGLFAALPQAAVGWAMALSCLMLHATGGKDDALLSRSSWRLPHLAQLPLAVVVAVHTSLSVTDTPDSARARRRRQVVDWPILEVRSLLKRHCRDRVELSCLRYR
jgi:MFS family permease